MGRSPEELETLMEDALLLQDPLTLPGLFESEGILVVKSHVLVGRDAISRSAADVAGALKGYVAPSQKVYQAGNLALLMGDGSTSIARRDNDRQWRFAISIFDPPVANPRSQRVVGRTARRKERTVFVMVVRMSADPNRRNEVVAHLQRDVVTWAQRQPGFVSGQWLCAPEGDQAMGIVIFDSEDKANAASRSPRDYGRNERDEGRAWNIENVTVFEQVAQA